MQVILSAVVLLCTVCVCFQLVALIRKNPTTTRRRENNNTSAVRDLSGASAPARAPACSTRHSPAPPHKQRNNKCSAAPRPTRPCPQRRRYCPPVRPVQTGAAARAAPACKAATSATHGPSPRRRRGSDGAAASAGSCCWCGRPRFSCTRTRDACAVFGRARTPPPPLPPRPSRARVDMCDLRDAFSACVCRTCTTACRLWWWWALSWAFQAGSAATCG